MKDRFEKLQEIVERLSRLLNEQEVGLISWQTAVVKIGQELADALAERGLKGRQQPYGVWITNLDGSNGRWMSDNGQTRWEGSATQAEYEAAMRRGFYKNVRYEVKPVMGEEE